MKIEKQATAEVNFRAEVTSPPALALEGLGPNTLNKGFTCGRILALLDIGGFTVADTILVVGKIYSKCLGKIVIMMLDYLRKVDILQFL